MTPAEEDLIKRFESLSAAEKAAALRGMAREERDPKMRRKLIIAALRMDAITPEPPAVQWPHAPDTGAPFIDDDYFLPKKR
jgi:hypothetical protein